MRPGCIVNTIFGFAVLDAFVGNTPGPDILDVWRIKLLNANGQTMDVVSTMFGPARFTFAGPTTWKYW